MADIVINFPATGGELLTGGVIDIEMPATGLLVSGSATLTPFVYICDSGNNRIQVMDYEGNPLFTFGSYGSGDGKFSSPYGVCNDGERVYVSDTGNHRVQYFDLYGNYLGQWGAYGSVNGKFSSPKGIATNGRYVFVVDQGNNRFEIFTPGGLFIMALGSYGDGSLPNQFNAPTNCAVDSYFFYIDDTGNNRIVIYELAFIPDYIIATLPDLTTEFVMSVNMIDFNVSLPAKLETELVMTVNSVMSFDIALPGMNVESEHLLALSMDFDIALPGSATVMVQEIALSMNFDLSLPAVETEILMLAQETISFDIALPGPGVELYQIVMSAAQFNTIVMATLTKAVTEYSGWSFNSFAEFGGKQLGFSDAGLFELSGETDAGVAINAEFMSGDIDLHAGDEYAKRKIRRLYDVHVNRKATANITLLLQGEQDDNKTRSIDIQGSSDGLFHTKRGKPGKGLLWRLIRVGIKSKNGSDFEIDQIDVDAATIGRDA